MRRVIHHLRRQPEEVRRQVLYVATCVLGIILALLWVYSLGSRLEATSTEEFREDLAPLSDIKGNVIDGYNNLSEFNLE